MTGWLTPCFLRPWPSHHWDSNNGIHIQYWPSVPEGQRVNKCHVPEWSWAPRKVVRCFKNYSYHIWGDTVSLAERLHLAWDWTKQKALGSLGHRWGAAGRTMVQHNSSPAWSSQGQSSRHQLCQCVIHTNRSRHLLTVHSFNSTQHGGIFSHFSSWKSGNIQKSWERNPPCLRLARTFILWCSARVPATVINVYIHTTTPTSLLTYWNPPFYI